MLTHPHSQVYAVSDPFEIKALSAGYPPATNTPVDSQSATVSKVCAFSVIFFLVSFWMRRG
jgi:hypothetical protein